MVNYKYVHRYGNNDEERDIYEYQKIRALRRSKILPEYDKNPINVLTKAYSGIKLFEKQKDEKVLIDLI